MKKTKTGFTLIEMLIVVAILSIIGLLGLSFYVGARERTRDGKRKADLEVIRSALEMYRVDNDEYPDPLTLLEDENYMRDLPADPRATDILFQYNQVGGSTYCLGAYLESEDPGSCGDTICSSLDCVPSDADEACNYCVQNP